MILKSMTVEERVNELKINMKHINTSWEEHYGFLEEEYKKTLTENVILREELEKAKEELKELKFKRKIGDRGKQKKIHYKVTNKNTGEEKLFHTMKDIATEYGMSTSGINQHVRGWKVKKFGHLDILYLNKK